MPTSLVRSAAAALVALGLVGPPTAAQAHDAGPATPQSDGQVASHQSPEELWDLWEQHHSGSEVPEGAHDLVSWSPTSGQIEGSSEFESLLATELESSEFPRRLSLSTSGVATTYTISDNLEVTLVEPNDAGEDGNTPNISGGRDSRGLYVVLSPFEQDLILSGSGFVLTAAICAIPGVGWALCTAVGAVITVYSVWAGTQKRCQGAYPYAKVYPLNSTWNTCTR